MIIFSYQIRIMEYLDFKFKFKIKYILLIQKSLKFKIVFYLMLFKKNKVKSLSFKIKLSSISTYKKYFFMIH